MKWSNHRFEEHAHCNNAGKRSDFITSSKMQTAVVRLSRDVAGPEMFKLGDGPHHMTFNHTDSQGE